MTFAGVAKPMLPGAFGSNCEHSPEDPGKDVKWGCFANAKIIHVKHIRAKRVARVQTTKVTEQAHMQGIAEY